MPRDWVLPFPPWLCCGRPQRHHRFLLPTPPSHSHAQRQGQEAHDGTLLRFYDYCYSQSCLFEPCYTWPATAAFPVNSHQKGEALIAVAHPQKFKMLSCSSVQTYQIAHLRSTASSVWCSVTRSSLFCTAQYHSCSVEYVNYPILYCTHP